MKNILIISLLGVFGFFTGCAPVTCEELDRHAQIVGIEKDATTGKVKLSDYPSYKVQKADTYKTAGSKKIAKKTYADQIEAGNALAKGGKAKLKCKFSVAKRKSLTSTDVEWEEGKDEVDLSELTSDFEKYAKDAKEELAKL